MVMSINLLIRIKKVIGFLLVMYHGGMSQNLNQFFFFNFKILLFYFDEIIVNFGICVFMQDFCWVSAKAKID